MRIRSRLWLATPDPEAAYAEVTIPNAHGGERFPYEPSEQGAGVVEWLPVSRRVGDLVWAEGEGRAFFTQAAASAVEALGLRGLKFLPVREWREPETTRTGGRVPPPLVSPLQELHVTRWARIDRQMSTFRRPLTVNVGGRERELLPPRGVEWFSYDEHGMRVRHRRKETAGYFVHACELGDDAFVRLWEWPHEIFVTDGGHQALKDLGLTNLEFLEYGAIVD